MPYRDDEAALGEARGALVEEIARLDAELTRLEEHARRRDELTRALRSLDARMAARRPRLPALLERARIASPCSMRWEDMLGDERVRFCPSCAKNVYDLASLGDGEAEALIARTEGRFCGRLRKRRDERVLTNDCPVGARRRGRLGLAAATLAAGSAAAAGVAHADLGEKPLLLMVKGSESVESHVQRALAPAPPEPRPRRLADYAGMLGMVVIDDPPPVRIVVLDGD